MTRLSLRTRFPIPDTDLTVASDPPEGARDAQAHALQLRRKTPFYPRILLHNRLNLWSSWAGYTVPTRLDDLDIEYSAIRNTASLFDLSPMIKVAIEGPDAERLLNRVTVRDVRRHRVGRVQYTLWCDDDGKVMDDGTVFRLSDTSFLLCAQERVLRWLSQASHGLDVGVQDKTEDIAALALQGPTSATILLEAGFPSIQSLRPFEFAEEKLPSGAALRISRTGFTGDLGYELWVPTDAALELWDLIWDAGHLFGLKVIGGEALNMARIEAGFVMTNHDFIAAHQAVRPDRRRSPYELGLERLVDFGKGHFNGRRALLREREDNTSVWTRVGLDIEDNKPAHQALVFAGNSEEVGHITAAMWSPITKRNIAFAMLRAPWGRTRTTGLSVEIYVQNELQWTRLLKPARIVKLPFYDPPRRRQTPPPRF